MNTSNKTVLITGGSAGIGLEIARLFSRKGSHVIITGRNESRLLQAAAELSNVTPIVADVTKEEEVKSLVKTLETHFPDLSIVVNNAGKAFLNPLHQPENAFEKASDEILTNYLAVVRLNEALLPLLSRQPEAAIVNVSSIVAFAPNHITSTYSASKAALHSYTQSLRLGLAKTTAIKVFELMPPLVNTDFSQEIGGANGISPTVVAEDLVEGLESETPEIRTGRTDQLYQLFRQSPEDALAAMNS